MINLADIKRRIQSVKQTRQITGAMETVSVSKMRKSAERLSAFNAYYSAVVRISHSVLAACEENSFVKPVDAGKPLVVVFSSDKGLCGGFNHELFKFADRIVEGAAVLPIGGIARDRYAKHSDLVKLTSDLNTDKLVKELSDLVMSGYGEKFNKVIFVFNELGAHSECVQTAKQILPVECDKVKNDGLHFEPNREDAAKYIVPEYVCANAYYAVYSNSAAEHFSRRAAMSAATKNADEMIETLSIEYNRARQSAVTSQITEIIGTARALQKVRK